ncbi:MAG: FxsA family protein [Pseudomonadota bacterium]
MVRILLFLVLVGVPIAEVSVFLLVGSIIGALPTILLIVATAVLGMVLLRRQGLSVLAQLQADLRAERVPAKAMGEAVTIAIAGVLLLTPGFITDAIGFALFIPAVRRRLWRKLGSGFKVERAEYRQRRSDASSMNERVIELDEGDYRAAPSNDTPWQGPPRD